MQVRPNTKCGKKHFRFYLPLESFLLSITSAPSILGKESLKTKVLPISCPRRLVSNNKNLIRKVSHIETRTITAGGFINT